MGNERKNYSVLEAIKAGEWDFEPEKTEEELYDCSQALPGSEEKLEMLANRLAKGLPLWHSDDRLTFDGDDSQE